MNKKCTACFEIKDISLFSKNPKMKDGYIHQCKSCVLIRRKKFYKENLETFREKRKKEYKKNRDKYIRDAVSWGKRNKDKRKISKKRWASKNVVKISVINRNLSAKKQGAIGFYTVEEYISKLNLYNNKCGYCLEREPYTVDHIIPISKGGNNYIENIMPSCLQCNGQKRDYLLEEWFLLPNCYNKNKHLLDKPTN